MAQPSPGQAHDEESSDSDSEQYSVLSELDDEVQMREALQNIENRQGFYIMDDDRENYEAEDVDLDNEQGEEVNNQDEFEEQFDEQFDDQVDEQVDEVQPEQAEQQQPNEPIVMNDAPIEFNQYFQREMMVAMQGMAKSLATVQSNLNNSFQTRDNFVAERFAEVAVAIQNLSNTVPNANRVASTKPVKMPNIPDFDGTIENYRGWRQTFDAMVMDQPYTTSVRYTIFKKAIMKVKKLSHMVGWKNTESNLKLSLAHMEKVYNELLTLVNKLIENLKETPEIIGHEVEAVQELYNAYMAVLSSLKEFKMVELKRDELRNTIMSKLSMKIKNQIFDKVGKEKNLEIIHQIMDKIYVKNKELREVPLSEHDKKKLGLKRKVTEVVVKAVDIAESSHSRPKRRMLVCQFDGLPHRYRECKLPLHQRWKLAKERKLCFRCLVPNHQLPECKQERGCMFCRGKHHPYLCSSEQAQLAVPGNISQPERNQVPCAGNPVEQGVPSAVPATNKDALTVNLNNSHQSAPTNFKTLITTVGLYEIRLFFDEGSGGSFITAEAATKAGLSFKLGPRFIVSGFGGEIVYDTNQYVEAEFKELKENNSLRLRLLVVDRITRSSYPALPNWIWSHKEKPMDYYDRADKPVELLLGLKHCQKILGNSQEFLQLGIFRYDVQTTKFGSIVYGGLDEDEEECLVNTVTVKDLLNEIEPEDQMGNDNFVERFVNEYTAVVNGRVEVVPPVIDVTLLQHNQDRCWQILQRQMSQWLKTDKVQIVENILKEWEEAGIIEITDNNILNSHYLSYHVVTRPESTTTKHRLVFNGSLAGTNGVSLNDCLFKGNTNWCLVGSLIQF